MEIKENFDSLSADAREFLNLKIEELKLSFVERLSLFFADALSWLAVIIFLLLSSLCFLAALVAMLSVYMGLLPALLLVAFLLLAVAWLFHLLRGSIFINIMVARFYKMFFTKNDENDEKE